tara:strand:- start:502 stop:1320 length:819 start_codon:yes stop_codon:yes gene_type:complete
MSKKSGGRRSAITKGPEKLAEAGTAAAIEKTRPKYRVLVKTAIKSLGGKADHKQIMAYAKEQNFKNLNARTLRAHLNFMTVNTPSRVDYPSHRKARGYNPDYDVLYSTGRGSVELYNPKEHGNWTIMEDENGKTQIAKNGIIVRKDSPVFSFEELKNGLLRYERHQNANYLPIAVMTLLNNQNYKADWETILKNVKQLCFWKISDTVVKEMCYEEQGEKVGIKCRDENGKVTNTFSLNIDKLSSGQEKELKTICGKMIAQFHISKMNGEADV